MSKAPYIDLAKYLLIFLLACGSLWQVFEMDIYWMVRAGEEILTKWQIPMLETWSYTSEGKEWLNTHWLSELIAAVIFRLGDDAALVVGRGFYIALLLFVCLKIVEKVCRNKWTISAVFCCLPLIFTMQSLRIQLRADSFVLISFAGIILVWLSEMKQTRKLIYSGILIVLAANLHAGSALFTFALALAFIVANKQMNIKSISTWGSLYFLALFASPIHFKSLDFIVQHFFYSDQQVLGNPDHVGIGALHYTMLNYFGLGFWVFAFFTAISFYFLFFFRDQLLSKFPLYNQKWLAILVGAVLTAMTINRDRALMYQSIFFLPVFCAALLRFFEYAKSLNKKYLFHVPIVTSMLAIAVSIININLIPRSYGFTSNRQVFPVTAAEFIKSRKIMPNLYHSFTFGAYAVWYLREYKLFGDTRETPFKHLEELYLGAYHSPEVSRSIYEKYKVNAIWVAVPKKSEFIQGKGFRDIISEYNPIEQWALVYFDNLSVIVVKKIPEHANLISEYEYKILKPQFPPNVYIRSEHRNEINDKAFLAELDRCLHLNADSVFCQSVAVIWQLSIKEATKETLMLEIKKLENIIEKYRPEDVHLLVELLQAYSRVGLDDKAKDIEKKLDQMFSSAPEGN
ncbi:MAG: hypothetical protein KBD78_12140 [Oligoflexales bacterium]|nr:hypothetical protein [Oligoflexales bacterium]